MARITDKNKIQFRDTDFKVRKPRYLLPICLAIVVTYIILFFAGVGLWGGSSLVMYGSILLIVLFSTSAIVLGHLQRQHDLVTVSEFQSTLFSSAARINWFFCIILKSDGSIVYIDPGFRELFSQVNPRDLTDVAALKELNFLTDEHQRVLDAAIRDEKSAFVVAHIPQGEGQPGLKSAVTLEPLKRPRGYYALRARAYIERDEQKKLDTASLTAASQPPAATLPAEVNVPAVSSVPTSLHLLSEIVSNAPISLAIVDSDGKVLDCNESFRQITYRTRYTREGWNFVETLAPSYRSEFLEHLKKIGTPSHPYNTANPLDIRIIGEKEGDTENAASLYISLFHNVENGGTGYILYLLDTTEQKNLEMRYAHSQKMQAVGQLAGGVAHDFNNLLTAMIGFCDLLLMRHPAGDQSFPDIMQVKQNANRAANLVRQLLAFSRRQTLQPKLLDMTEVLAELSNLIRRLIGENIELKVIHGRDIGMVKADQGQLEQVLINLAVNARDAMSGNGGSLTLRTSTLHIKNLQDLERGLVAPADDDQIIPGEYVLVEIIDTGTGISPENIQKIFEPFFSTKEVGSGTGLGLATVYGIIKQTGGYLYVHSQLGVGTRFQLYFPRYEARPQDASTEEKVEKEHQGDLTGMGTILLVEDEAPVRNFAARALRNKGYTVLEADCGEAALDIIKEQGGELDIIVSDVIMPGMNGPEMIKRVMPDYPHVKVIFISGYAEDAFADSFGEDYQFNFLPKPFTLKQLASKVKEVLGGE